MFETMMNTGLRSFKRLPEWSLQFAFDLIRERRRNMILINIYESYINIQQRGRSQDFSESYTVYLFIWNMIHTNHLPLLVYFGIYLNCML